MAFKGLAASLKNYPWAHIPTWVLLIGTAVFWLELYVVRLPYGHSSWLAWGLFGILLLVLVSIRWQEMMQSLSAFIRDWSGQQGIIKAVIALVAFLALGYLAIAWYASLLPPHLIQENDALNYHIMLPRQHLIRHSFTHIPWSVPDLFLLPLDYALSPFCLATAWPNKMVQFIFFMGSLGCVFQLVYLFSARSRARAWVGVLAVMACHGVAIQAGTAMLDVVMLYCFLAFVHSLLTGRLVWAAIELAFFFWSKSFIAPQMAVIAGLSAVIVLLFLRNKFSVFELPVFNASQWKIFGLAFFISSVLIAAPHLARSFYYTGTPLYPFGTGLFPPMAEHTQDYWHAIMQRAEISLLTKDAYGHGRSFLAFLKHFWLIAVPEQGVNNAFDYPVGLVYLLVLMPFIGHVAASLGARKVPVLSLAVVLWWLSWWFGSQQTRFLLIPICVMVIVAVAGMPDLSKIFFCLVIAALGLETVSLINAHRADWGKSYAQVIRDKDKQLLALSDHQGKNAVVLGFPDVAFAPFAVDVHNSNDIFVIPNNVSLPLTPPQAGLMGRAREGGK